jgi:hypothetical protein
MPNGTDASRLADAVAARAAEQCWVELTRGQVDDLLSMTQDRLAAVEGKIDEHDAADELRGRRSELLILKGMLLLGRDDPGAP